MMSAAAPGKEDVGASLPPPSPNATAGGHVHFNPDQVSHHDLEISVESAGPDALDVHLGFLQVGHVYEIDVPIVHRLRSLREADDSPTNPFIRLMSLNRPAGGGADVFSFELFAHKERLMRETLVLRDGGGGDGAEAADSDCRLTVQFHARVLGKLKGTPALKNGIRCIGMRSVDEGDCTPDWQGSD